MSANVCVVHSSQFTRCTFWRALYAASAWGGRASACCASRCMCVYTGADAIIWLVAQEYGTYVTTAGLGISAELGNLFDSALCQWLFRLIFADKLPIRQHECCWYAWRGARDREGRASWREAQRAGADRNGEHAHFRRPSLGAVGPTKHFFNGNEPRYEEFLLVEFKFNQSLLGLLLMALTGLYGYADRLGRHPYSGYGYFVQTVNLPVQVYQYE